jgi:hypothetical protein
MIEFEIHLEESLVQSFGYRKVEQYLQDIVQKIQLKLAAEDILNDLPAIDLENDTEWQLSREKAWPEV